MKITKIEQQKKDEKRYSIFLDGKFAFGLSGTDVLYFKLKEGEELEPKKYEYILEHKVYEEAKTKAFNYISVGYKTEKEVKDKLFSKEYSEEVVDKVIELLKKYDYVNDVTYAKKFIEYRTNVKKQGEFKIKHDLKLKGVSNDIISEVFEEFESDTNDTIVALIEKKAKGEKEFDFKEKQRITGFLLRKGFSYDEIKDGFRSYLEDGR